MRLADVQICKSCPTKRFTRTKFARVTWEFNIIPYRNLQTDTSSHPNEKRTVVRKQSTEVTNLVHVVEKMVIHSQQFQERL